MLKLLPFHSAVIVAALRYLRGKNWLTNPTRRNR